MGGKGRARSRHRSIGAPSEHAEIEETISPVAFEKMSSRILPQHTPRYNCGLTMNPIRIAGFALSFALLLPAAEQPSPKPRVFHVSKDGPLTSLEQARDAVRALKRQQGGTLKQPVTVYVHGGTYALKQPLLFGPEDSGAANCPVTYRAFQNETPVFSGGRAITGWKEVTVDGKHLWAAEIPAVKDGTWYFRELWANGERRQRARGPNQGFYRMAGVPDLDVKAPYHIGQKRFQYSPGEIQKWDNFSDVEVVILHFWVSTRRPMASIDEEKRIVTLTQPSSMRMTDGFGKTPELARYYVENAFELLDAPGEWYLNRKTGTIYYMPMPGEKIGSFEAVAPVLDQLMTLEGDPRADRFVENLTFRGLTFSHAEWWLPANVRGGQYQEQASADVPAAIRAYGMRNSSFEACKVSHISDYGIHLSRGCSRDRIVACELFDLGGGGIKVGEPDKEGHIHPDENGVVHDQPSEETHDIEIADNHIHDGGKVFHQAMGIIVFQCYNNAISHNHVHHLYKNAISVGWSWGFGKSLARNNTIEWNHIHDIGNGWFNDGGAIYTLGIQPGTVIRNNLMHDIGSVVYGGRGVYLDQASSGIVAENNIAYHTTGGGYAQTLGKNNIVRNNIFALAKMMQIEPNGGGSWIAKNPGVNSFTFERNIVYLAPEGNLLKEKWIDSKVVMRNNLYWREGGGEIKAGPESWAQWRARGLDEGSMVADPLFVDPAKGDFRLKPGSPALKIGFEPFDLSGVGPRPAVAAKLRESE
jgi:hypothetical protein